MNVLRDISFFFWKKEGFWVLFSSWAENCNNLAMNLEPTVKMRFFCLEELFQGDCFFSEKKVNTVVFSLKKWAEPFKNLKRWIFDKKYQHGCQKWNPRFQRDSLRNFSSRKKIICKNVFAAWMEVRYVSSKNFGRFVKKASLRPDEFVEEKYVFLEK